MEREAAPQKIDLARCKNHNSPNRENFPYIWRVIKTIRPMKLIGRVEEAAFLKGLLDKDEAEFVAVYGRR